MLKAGDKAPGFSLEDASGKARSLAEWKGRKIILYFYPKDDTPGCTKEACGFRDRHAEITSKGALVVGISADKPASHARFAEKYGLPFVLLSDPEHKALEAYGVWGEKKLYGKVFMGISRSTFLIDEEGRIEKAWPKVSPEGHAEELLEALGGV
ncbi:MAG TPA: thioredoxin-dependent thiol peroxidase [Rectinemataceae bacterium]|nr:thioredoxin-dependent thiol peroxidase [Rectinemataceae bacterium]